MVASIRKANHHHRRRHSGHSAAAKPIQILQSEHLSKKSNKKNSSRRSSASRSAIPASPTDWTLLQTTDSDSDSAESDMSHSGSEEADESQQQEEMKEQQIQQQNVDMTPKEEEEAKESEIPTGTPSEQSSAPAAAAPAEVAVPSAEQPSTPTTASTVTESAPSSAASASSSASEAEFSPAEHAMLAALSSVRQRLGEIEFTLPVLARQIEDHSARLCAFRLAKHFHSLAMNSNKLNLAHKSLRYKAGLVDEQCMQAIFRLDSLQTDNNFIRQERKATVARGKKIIDKSIQLCKKIDKLLKWLPAEKEEEEQKESTSLADVMTDGRATPQPPADAHIRPASPTPSVSSSPPQVPRLARAQRKSPQAETPVVRVPTAATAVQPAALAQAAAAPLVKLSALERKYQHLQLPKWSGPQFACLIHPRTGALIIQADLSGVRSEDLSVTADSDSRIITVQGVKLPVPRRQHALAAHGLFGFVPVVQQREEPYGFFERRIHFADIDAQKKFNLDELTATIDEQRELNIAVPLAPTRVRQVPVQQQRRQQPPRRLQQQWLSGFDDECDDEEQPQEDDAYAQLYRQHILEQHRRAQLLRLQQQQQQRQRAQYARASPFFGGFW